MRHVAFVIAGHVDHGKSTLIGRLLCDTGSVPQDRIEEVRAICESLGSEMELRYVLDDLAQERKEGITIDTTQAVFRAGGREYTIIDAPGHVEFLQNMITGASQAEAAILIIDAREGVREQTRRHAYMLKLLGIEQLAVVVNKMDLVGWSQRRFAALASQAGGMLGLIGLRPAAVIPLSASEGDNVIARSRRMPWYRGPTVIEALAGFTPAVPPAEGPTRFAAQDVYDREKRIVVGRVENGTVSRGQELVVLPAHVPVIVTSLEDFGREVRSAGPGKALGIVTEGERPVERGDILCAPADLPKPRTEFPVRLFWMDREPIGEGDPVTFRCSTQEAMCRIAALKRVVNSATLESSGRRSLGNREVAEAVLETGRPVVIESFYRTPELGRFVLERLNICAGGIITEDLRC